MQLYEILITACLAFFSLLGLYSCYCFAKPYLDRKRGKKEPAGHIGAICKDGSCIVLEHTRWARLFGFPNWWLGIGFYLLTLVVLVWSNVWAVTVALACAIAAFFVTLLLIYGLVVHLKAYCKYCYFAHFCNFGILLTWLIALWQAPVS